MDKISFSLRFGLSLSGQTVGFAIVLIRLKQTLKPKMCASFEAITGAEKPCHILQQQKEQHKEQSIAGVEKKVMHIRKQKHKAASTKGATAEGVRRRQGRQT